MKMQKRPQKMDLKKAQKARKEEKQAKYSDLFKKGYKTHKKLQKNNRLKKQ